MRLPILFAAPSLLGAQAPSVLPPDPASMTVDQVLAKYFDAQGGLAKLKAVQSRHITGHIEGLPDPISFDQLNARPDRIRLETRTESKDAPASDQIKTYDGKAGWAWSNTETARVMEPEEVKVLDADFDGPLVDAAAKGNKVEFKGLQDF
jgi:hypothetical protein